MKFLAIFFPWLIFLFEDNPGGALVAFIMQASVIGWPPASIWALRTLSASRKAKAQQALRDDEKPQKKTG